MGSLLLDSDADRERQDQKGESFRNTDLLSTLIPTYTRAAPYFLPEAGRWFFSSKFPGNRGSLNQLLAFKAADWLRTDCYKESALLYGFEVFGQQRYFALRPLLAAR